MIEYILIFTLYAGALSNADSVALISVPHFKSEAECKAAGDTAGKLGTIRKGTNYVCVKQTQ